MDTGNKLKAKHLFNSMKILIIVFEFAMHSLELEIIFKKKIKFISDLPTLIFITMLAETQHFFLYGLIKVREWKLKISFFL
jgi:hypothetical protein